MRDQQSRTRVAVVFGGRSAEHDVSVRSAESVLANLDILIATALARTAGRIGVAAVGRA